MSNCQKHLNSRRNDVEPPHICTDSRGVRLIRGTQISTARAARTDEGAQGTNGARTGTRHVGGYDSAKRLQLAQPQRIPHPCYSPVVDKLIRQ